MDEFFKQMAPHLAANLLAIWFFYSAWRFSKIEQEDPHGSRGLPELFSILAVFAFMGYGVWLSNS